MKLFKSSILLIIGWAVICSCADMKCKPSNVASIKEEYQLVPLKNGSIACINVVDYYSRYGPKAGDDIQQAIEFIQHNSINFDSAIPGLGPLYQPGTPFYGRIMDDIVSKAIKFYVYEPGKKDPLILDSLDDLDTSLVEKTGEIVFLVHGWTANHDSDVIEKLAEAYEQQKYPAILIGVDWSSMSKREYVDSRGHVYGVGMRVGEQTQKFLTKTKVFVKLACVGHSLGAHVCGMIGKSTSKLDFIIGLDPASPLFFDESKDVLQKTDARYVEVIHTCTMFLGYESPRGHADIYPFTGVSQPGCLEIACSHSKSISYFIDAVDNKSLDIVPCKSVEKVHENSCENGDHTKISGTKLIQKSGIFTNVYQAKDNSWIGDIVDGWDRFKDAVMSLNVKKDL